MLSVSAPPLPLPQQQQQQQQQHLQSIDMSPETSIGVVALAINNKCDDPQPPQGVDDAIDNDYDNTNSNNINNNINNTIYSLSPSMSTSTIASSTSIENIVECSDISSNSGRGSIGSNRSRSRSSSGSSSAATLDNTAAAIPDAAMAEQQQQKDVNALVALAIKRSVKRAANGGGSFLNSTGNFVNSCLSFLLRTYTIRRWIEKLLELELPDGTQLFGSLGDGVILCRLMLSVKANSIPKIHTGTSLNFKIRENFLFFTQAMEDIGVSRFYQFTVSDLHERKNYIKVLESLEVFADMASNELLTKQPEKTIDPLTDEQAATIQFTEQDIASAEAHLKRLNVNRLARQPCRKSTATKDQPKRQSKLVPLVHQSLPNLSSTLVSSTSSSSSPSGSPYKSILKNKSASQLLTPGQILLKARPYEKKWIKVQALVRGHLARRDFHKRVRNSAYRHNIADELLATEEMYIKHLDRLIVHYFEPIQEQATRIGIKATMLEEFKKIFSNIEVIRNYNSSLLADLKPVIENWSNSKTIGKIFIQFIFLLKVYTQYVKEFTQTFETIKNMRKNNPKFDQCITELEDMDYKHINDYLILPVQRIPRYTLLLADLVKNTWPDHPDYQDLTESLKRMQDVAMSINEKKREAENIQKVSEIQSNFVGKFENLAEPHRRFVHEGPLCVVAASGKESQRIFYLFNDVLVGAKSTTSGLLRKDGRKVKESIRMNLVTVKLMVKEVPICPAKPPPPKVSPRSHLNQLPAPISPHQSSPSTTTAVGGTSALSSAPVSLENPHIKVFTKPLPPSKMRTVTNQSNGQQTLTRQSAPPSTPSSSSKPPLVTQSSRSRTSTNSPTGIPPLPKQRSQTLVSPPPSQINKPTAQSLTPPRPSHSALTLSANRSPMTSPSSPSQVSPIMSPSGQSAQSLQLSPLNDNTTTKQPDLIIELVDSFGACILRLLCPNLKDKEAWLVEFKKVQEDLDNKKLVNEEAMKRSQEKAGFAKAALSQQYATLRFRGKHLALTDIQKSMEDADNKSVEQVDQQQTTTAAPLPIGFASPKVERDFMTLRKQTIGRRSQQTTKITGSLFEPLDSNPTPPPSSSSSQSTPPSTKSSATSLEVINSRSNNNNKELLLPSTTTLDTASAADELVASNTMGNNKKSGTVSSWFATLRFKKKKPASQFDSSGTVGNSTQITDHHSP
ncbi:hypothetical protein SAMD00019534_095200 [Acytostelium subglobosum LB1]|uniref:hypothetical protein n=1 Tax=Acytostelium subglobosum LB1 TaxID=1410327 RepID=UPI000644FED1|nr:hypothetical protein SAMD00019534_095200 [Acytostelium subglobosum LB1]GAM26345.1 hypothetical protein SAMD00019534_095200 [Acytostelium subglobosum LB1]|eukprot:XP_012750899.1 hypothetical protein SAMD00019534_095200 [Acytostelium subglobosum LB1]